MIEDLIPTIIALVVGVFAIPFAVYRSMKRDKCIGDAISVFDRIDFELKIKEYERLPDARIEHTKELQYQTYMECLRK
jgi:hypothetical protein